MRFLYLTPRVVHGSVSIDGICFQNSTFIDLSVGEVPIVGPSLEEEGTCFWPELLRSQFHSGSFLLFTCYCGVADDAGWNTVQVKHSNDSVSWIYEREHEIQILFNRDHYISAIQSCAEKLRLEEFPLAVKNAIWPE